MCTRCASRSAPRYSWRSRSAFRCTKLPSRASPRSRTSTRGPPTISACSTCIASIAVDNGAAIALFQRAVEIDPTFARAHAGLSFVHFQSAFMHYTDDIAGAISRGTSLRGAWDRARSPRSVRQLHDGPHLLVGGRSRNQPGLARARDGHQPALCARHLCAGMDGGVVRPRRSMPGSTSISRCA